VDRTRPLSRSRKGEERTTRIQLQRRSDVTLVTSVAAAHHHRSALHRAVSPLRARRAEIAPHPCSAHRQCHSFAVHKYS
jgi:hypothetical protein